MIELIAQGGFVRDRRGESSCVADNGFCPDWIVDNLDRYWTPLLEHVVLVLVSVGLGFAIALALGLLAHRRRWLVTPLTGITSAIYTIPSPAMFLLLLPVTGRGNATAIIALDRLHAGHHLPQRRQRPAGRARGHRRRGAPARA